MSDVVSKMHHLYLRNIFYILSFCLCTFLIPSFTKAQNSSPTNKPSHETQAVILQYHHVSTDTPPITSISPDDFMLHINYLLENNFNILPLEQILNNLQNGEELADFTAAITFDDAYLSVYTEAFPLLKELNWPFSIFVTTGLIGSNERLYATWDQIREMAEAGATIANHTVNHPYFLERNVTDSISEWLDPIKNEITQAEDKILQETGQSHRLLAYPYGEYEPRIQAIVQELGFIALAQHSGPINANSDFTALPRFPFSGNFVSMNTFPNKVKSLAIDLDDISPNSPLTMITKPRAEIDINESTTRITQLSCFNNSELINTEILDQDSLRFSVSTHIENNNRRFRYNCTAPGVDGRYYWYSIPWINSAIAE